MLKIARLLIQERDFVEIQQLKLIKNPELTVPSFRGVLKPFQRIGVTAAFLHPRIILGDEAGLGKTIQSIATLCLLYDHNKLPNKTTLVVCPNGMKEDWQRAIQKFSPFKAIIGYSEDRNCNFLNQNSNVVITSFNTLLNRAEVLEKHGFQNIIVDEASYVKNTESKTFQALKRLTNKARRVLICNATSIENSVVDAFAMGELIEPGFFGTYQEFLNAYAETEIKYFRTKYRTLKSNTVIVGPKSLESIQVLKQKISKFYLRRSYDEVEIELPSEVVKNIPVALKECQKKEYLELIKKFKKREIKPASLLYKLLRVCDGKMEDWSKVDKPEKVSAKGEALIDLVNSFNKDQFIVYSTYIDPLMAAAKIVKGMGLRIGFYTGVNTESREAHSDAFKDGKIDCLLITKAGARGKNWGNARHLVEINTVFNPSLQYQIRCRIKRLDSVHKTVFIYKLFAEDTIEENVLALLERKGALSKYINDNDELDKLSEKQIELLLSRKVSLINPESLDYTYETLAGELEKN